MRITKGLFTSTTDNWATPQWLFDELDKTFHFTLDVCASDENHKCDNYFTKESDGLKQDWGGCYLVQSAIRQGNCWMGGEMLKAQRSGSYASTC